MNILIVKTSAIGDVTHTLPTLTAIRKQYPNAKITWLVEEEAADIVTGHPLLDRVLISRRKSWVKQIKKGNFLATIREIRQFFMQLRDTYYDLIIDFQGLLKSGILVFLARGKRKVGFGRGMEHAECSYLFLNERIPPVAMDQHAVVRESLLLNAIGIHSKDVEYEMPVDSEHEASLLNMLIKKGIAVDKQPIVSINPVATWPTKLWENNRFASVADRLAVEGITVIFTGGLDDESLIEEILSKMKFSAVNMAGQTSLKTLAALYKKSSLVISTDTGPMHIAASVGTPVVALFGPTAPWRTGPYGKQHTVLRAEMACSPCLKRDCPTVDCMKKITVEDVVDAAKARLDIRQINST